MKPIRIISSVGAACLLALANAASGQQPSSPSAPGEQVRRPETEKRGDAPPPPKPEAGKEKDKPEDKDKPGKPNGPGHHERRGAELRPTPYLGIHARPPGPDLRAQAGLAEGFGLVVEEILPESPAAKAGLKQHDVIVLLGDQRIANIEQLTALVRAAGKDAEVEITLRRAGEEVKAKARVGEKALPVHPEGHPPTHPPMGAARERVEQIHRQIEERRHEMRRHMERMGDHFREHMKQFQERMQHGFGPGPGHGPGPKGHPGERPGRSHGPEGKRPHPGMHDKGKPPHGGPNHGPKPGRPQPGPDNKPGGPGPKHPQGEPTKA